jgi:hypothetical protein
LTHRVQGLLLLLTLAGPAHAAPPVEAAIDALLHDDSLKVRTQAAIILGQRGAAAAIPALRQAVAQDESAAVRIAAVGALAKLRARVARPTLIAARDADPEEAVRAAAIRALSMLGSTGIHIQEPTGTPSAREAVRTSLTNRLRELGLTVAESGEIRLKPKVIVDVSNEGGKTVISVKASVVIVDADNHLDMMDGSARATVNGTLPPDRLAATSAKVVDAALQGVSQDLAARLGRR